MRVIRAIAYICLMAVILVSGYMLELKMNEYRTALDIQTKRTLEIRKGRDVDFEKLKSRNPDTKGWIWLKDTNIDYPIVQGPDNDYYLHRDFDGGYLYDGCIFIDAGVEDPFSADENTVIYGHRMMSGAMFNNLGKYADREFFEEHPVIIIETEDKSYDLHVIAFCKELSDSGLYTTSFDEEWEGEPEYSDDGSEESEKIMTKSDFLDLVRQTAVNLSDEPFDEDDAYVTLSTCAYSSGDDRNQVIGILKDAPLEEKTVVTENKRPLFNKWLVLQILTGVFAAIILVLPLLPAKKR